MWLEKKSHNMVWRNAFVLWLYMYESQEKGMGHRCGWKKKVTVWSGAMHLCSGCRCTGHKGRGWVIGVVEKKKSQYGLVQCVCAPAVDVQVTREGDGS